MLIVSFNVNSVRLRMHQLESIISKYNPHVIALQETKVTDDDFPINDIKSLGYDVEFHGQKTHYGVATMMRVECKNCRKGFASDADDAQRRMIMTEVVSDKGNTVTILNGYFPQGENRAHEVKFPAKEKFYRDLSNTLSSEFNAAQNVVVTGDFNVAPVDNDIGIGPDNAKRWLRTGNTSFLPEEREWMQRLIDWGLVDTFRQQYPDTDELFSWFDYRSKGFDRDPKRGLRIDHVLATSTMASALLDSGIDYDVRAMEKPSDHCPVWSSFDI